MTTTGRCGDRDLGLDAPQSTRAGERQALRSAMKRAARAQRRLHEAIYRAEACGDHDTSSSSESDGEGQGRGALRGRRSAGEGGRAQFHHHQPHHGPWAGRHGMRGFPSGRQRMGFPGFGAGFPGMMSHGMGPHVHPHPHHHHHGHHHHHHHRHGALGNFHAFGGRGGHCGRGPGLAHVPSSGPFGRHFPHFCGVGHCSGRRERAHCAPRF